MDTLQGRILDRLRRAGAGQVFISKDFLDLGTRLRVDQALSRLAKAGFVQRLSRGLYAHPRKNLRLGIDVPSDVDDIAQALGRQTNSRVVPSGALAANRLGLTTQVPAKLVYLTDASLATWT